MPCPRPAQWRHDQAGLGHVLGLVASHEGVRAEGPEASLAPTAVVSYLKAVAFINNSPRRFSDETDFFRFTKNQVAFFVPSVAPAPPRKLFKSFSRF